MKQNKVKKSKRQRGEKEIDGWKNNRTIALIQFFNTTIKDQPCWTINIREMEEEKKKERNKKQKMKEEKGDKWEERRT